MTRNGHFLSLVSLCAVVLAVVIESRPALAAAFALAALLIVDGALFLVVVRAGTRLRFRRFVGTGAEHGVVFCGRTTTISVEVKNPTRYHLFARLEDLIPPDADIDGDTTYSGDLSPAGTTTISFRLTGDELATVLFPGLSLSVFSPGGFWRVDRFVRLPGSVRIVPDIFGKHFLAAWRKVRNVLLRHGRHQQRRAGHGAELLSLRSYQEGDPMKAIAWLASARRDQILTKEFENEVPVHVRVIFQPSLRFWQKRQPAVTQAATYVAQLARILAEHRDLVELVVARPGKTARTGAGLTRRHLGAVLSTLGEAVAAPEPVPGPLEPRELPLLHRLAVAHEPDLRHAGDLLLARRFRIRLFRSDPSFTRRIVALFLSVRFDLGIGGIALLHRNPELLGYFARRFFGELGLVPAPSAGMTAAWALAQSAQWARVLNRLLSYLTRHAQDEELYVIVADAALLPARERNTFLRHLRYGRAAGHRFVVFWPTFGPAPEGAVGDLYTRFARRSPELRRSLRALGIPGGPFDPEEGFLPVLSQINLLRRREGVRAW